MSDFDTLLDQHVTLNNELVDRIFLNGYVGREMTERKAGATAIAPAQVLDRSSFKAVAGVRPLLRSLWLSSSQRRKSSPGGLRSMVAFMLRLLGHSDGQRGDGVPGQVPTPFRPDRSQGQRDRHPRNFGRASRTEPGQRLLSFDPPWSFGASDVERISKQTAPAGSEVGVGQRAFVERGSFQLQVPKVRLPEVAVMEGSPSHPCTGEISSPEVAVMDHYLG